MSRTIYDMPSSAADKVKDLCKNYQIDLDFVSKDAWDKLGSQTVLVNDETAYSFLFSVILYCIYVNKYVHKNNPNYFQLPFMFSCSPPNIVDRVDNQSSVFIYQNYLRDRPVWPGIQYGEMFGIQKIMPKYEIKIRADKKRNILRSLDSLGINEKFIYGGYDSIANTIKLRCQEFKDEKSKTQKAIDHITQLLNHAEECGAISITIRSGNLAKALGLENRLPICCNAMRKIEKYEKEESSDPDSNAQSGESTSIRMTYFLNKPIKA